MSKSIEEQLRARIDAEYDVSVWDPKVREQFFRDVEVALVLARREAWRLQSSVCGPADGRHMFPLPPRTRQVLREEPVPGAEQPLWRWRNGGLERSYEFKAWEPWTIGGRDFPLMRHALDLHDNPYRTVEEPVDEDHPWPEVE